MARGGAGADGGGESGGAGGEKPPVPYAVFADTNKQLRDAKAQLDAANERLAQYGATRAQLAATQARASVDVQLAKAGVRSDAGRDYLAQRYLALPDTDRPEPGAWIDDVRKEEPAFFGAPSAGGGTGADEGGGSKVKPKTSPDATGTDATDRVNRPLTAQTIGEMSEKEFADRFSEVVAHYNSQERRGT